MTNEEKLDALLEMQAGTLEAMLQFRITLLGLRSEVNALKTVLCADDAQKKRLAEEIWKRGQYGRASPSASSRRDSEADKSSAILAETEDRSLTFPAVRPVTPLSEWFGFFSLSSK